MIVSEIRLINDQFIEMCSGLVLKHYRKGYLYHLIDIRLDSRYSNELVAPDPNILLAEPK
jgi:hypothetical protein